ncbi:MAG TPA: lysozyme inhibitor LprI family protein [Lichenihabitans sp.]|jgi:uncharacterized protein YecT (DUF1311 family)|nr:lysozyme inhibitor LprI family protein [Lichenihabitans sp.]
MMRSLGVAAVMGIGVLAATTPAQALDCHSAKARIERTICASPSLRQQDSTLDKTYADALARLPARVQELRKSQAQWLADREAGCATPDRKALARCIEAQDRTRLEALTLMLALAPAGVAPAPRASPAPPGAVLPKPGIADTDGTIRATSYVSDAVMLTFAADGTFEMKQLAGSKHAAGHFAYADGVLTLLDGTGDVGRTRFPLRCQVQKAVNGFAVSLGQTACRPLDGIAFRIGN